MSRVNMPELMQQNLRTLRTQEEFSEFLGELRTLGLKIIIKKSGHEAYSFRPVYWDVARVSYAYKIKENLIRIGQCDVSHLWRYMRIMER